MSSRDARYHPMADYTVCFFIVRPTLVQERVRSSGRSGREKTPRILGGMRIRGVRYEEICF